jgi:hypothetical protein
MVACWWHDVVPFAIYISLLAGTVYTCWPLRRTRP